MSQNRLEEELEREDSLMGGVWPREVRRSLVSGRMNSPIHILS